MQISGDRRFVNLSTRNAKLHMIHHGLDDCEQDGMKKSDRALVLAQIQRGVDLAGPFSGHPVGILKTVSGQAILVTEEVSPVQPKLGDCPTIEKFIAQLLPGEQMTYALLWLKLAVESLLNRDFRPRQVLCLFGASGCGKSLFQALITEILGGRVAKPYQYMMGETAFNADLCRAEHWCIEDEAASFDVRIRRKFGQQMKEAAVNPIVRMHMKGKDAFAAIPIYKALTISSNDEPENMMILPPLDDSILDKVILFKCGMADLTGNRKKDWKNLTSELPGFLDQLQKMPVPASMRDPKKRYGIKAFHHPEILEVLCSVSPEERFLQIIDQIIFPENKKDPLDFWRGRSIDLEAQLRDSKLAFAVEKLLHFSSACGVFLDRLKKKLPERFEKSASKGKTFWKIKPDTTE